MTLSGKGLRAKFTLVLFLVGLVPLLSTSVFFHFTSREALFQNVYKELRWNVNRVSGTIEAFFSETGRELILASQNAAFRMYFEDIHNRAHWTSEQKKTLRHLREIYPEIMDEACFIDSTGREIARIISDTLAREEELSSDEDRRRFFQKAFGVNEGEVFQGLPEISEDTRRLVMPMATPIAAGGKKAAILHFEISMGHFQRILRGVINPERGYGLIISDKGEFVAHTQLDINQAEPLPHAITSKTPVALMNIYKRMMDGARGIEEFSLEGKGYYISYRPITALFHKGVNENRWAIGFVIPGDRVYVEASILRYNLLSVLLTLVLVLILANVIGVYITRPIRELAVATRKVAAGEMPSLEVKGRDEIGQLSTAFNIMAEAVKRRDEALKELSITDGLTGLFNHRHFKSELEREFRSATRYKRPLTLIMADIDHFKDYNDEHGHTEGDVALKKVAEILSRSVREVDLPARYGGEEFAVILPETRIEDGVKVGERIRIRIQEEEFPGEKTQPNGDLTISVGVASFTEGMKDELDLINAADRALYRAKELGRNQTSRA